MGLLGHKIHHLLYVSSLTLLKTAATQRNVIIPPYKKQTHALAVWKLPGLPRVNHQYSHLLALPAPSPCLLQSREEVGGRGEKTRLLRPKGPFNGDQVTGLVLLQLYICSMVLFLPPIIFGFTTGNVDFLLQGWFLKIRHLLSNFFATSAPRAQGGEGAKFGGKK